MRYAQTMAFTTLVFFSIFTVFSARSDERSAFVGLFSNQWLWAAVALSVVLQVSVIYIPFLQQAFSTVSLSLGDWLRCALVASSVLWLRELSKVAIRRIHSRERDEAAAYNIFSIITSASRFSRSRPRVAIAVILPPERKVTALFRAFRSPEIVI